MKKFLLTFFCILCACSQVKDPHIISHLPHIQILEKEDHHFCSSLNLEFKKNDDLRSALYWRCRLSMAKYHLFPSEDTQEKSRHNLDVSDLIAKISLKISETPEASLLNENKNLDNHQHKRCLAMGFVSESEDQQKIEDYFNCRRVLLEDQKSNPPFQNEEYAKYPNNSYNLGFVVDRRGEEAVKKLQNAKEKYPTCVVFNLNGENFKRCTAAQDKSRQCFKEIDSKKFLRESEEKTTCQKRAYIEFPNEFIKDEDARKAEIERTQNNSDFYNKQNFAAIGIDDLSSFAGRTAKDSPKQEEKKSAKKLNSKAKLYSKFELTKLRQGYAMTCQKNAEITVNAYVEELKKSCQDLTNFTKLEDE